MLTLEYREPGKSLPPANVAPGGPVALERRRLRLLPGHNEALALLVRPSFSRATED